MLNFNKLKIKEEDFHDHWADNVNADDIDIRKINEACTSPEIKYIRKIIGNVKGKKLLDVGSGLGEASIYFAMEGAKVTATDISGRMLKVTKYLAKINNVIITTHKCDAEGLRFKKNIKFDIIYAGNLLHHVNINATLQQIIKVMDKNSIFVSWDPIAYNPIINIYRRIAKKVRTQDEHPLKINDFKTINRHFKVVHYEYFWFLTLLIFILMVVLERVNPNRERLWKKIVKEADKWEWLYKPLEKLDQLLFVIFPFIKYLCWNVVVVAKKSKAR